MYHYVFTNDLRISGLDVSLKNAGYCFINNTVPTASEDKSANNNMKTLGFYFNLTQNSTCAKMAAEGKIRAVVLNFIKKFQYPNLRTPESFQDAKNDAIELAPMRVIIKCLYMMNLMYGSTKAYLDRDEIKLFIFYNSDVAKKRNPDIVALINAVLQYRTDRTLPDTVDSNMDNHFWKQEDRQLREMIKVLVWSGCVAESENRIFIQNESLSRDNKADIYDIINCNSYWEGNDIDSYRRYMDISVDESSQWDDIIVEQNGSSDIKNKAENILLYGVPGSGKSHTISENYCSDEKFMERVVFHPDYTYSDFVGQILPRVDENGKLEYVFTEGPFTKVLKKAVNDPEHYYYLIIEELNRGNAPAIFGEIFQLLDRKVDASKFTENELGESVYGISNYDVARIAYKDATHQVRIPANMFVLATMNTADQNVFTLDTAFQRRWNMKQIENRFDNTEHSNNIIQGTNVSWGAFATTINEMVLSINQEMMSSEDKRLGTYFVMQNELQVSKFPEKVLKYLWDDAFKLEKTSIFKEQYRSLEEVISAYESTEKDRLEAVLRLDVYRQMISKMKKESTVPIMKSDEETLDEN